MPKSSADGVRWNLSDLYDSIADPRIQKDLEAAQTRAIEFESRFKEPVQNLSRQKDFRFPPLIEEYIEIVKLVTKPYVYAMLVFSADSKKPEHGALLQKVRSAASDIRSHYIFWELAWSRLDERVAESYYARPELAGYEHYLQHLRSYAPYLLGEQEEIILDLKENTGGRAFSRLFDETINSMVFHVTRNGKTEEQTESEALSLLHESDRELRKEGHRSLTEGFKANSRVLTYIFNMILENHKTEDKIRKFPHPMTARNLANEISERSVEHLVQSVKKAYPTVHRYYQLKKKLLGLDTLYDYDRYAPISDREPGCDFRAAREKVRRAYHVFHPEVGRIVDQFFDKNWIDAELRPGKQGGAFCADTLPELHPYVLTNFSDKLRDVMTLAHELGHGVHQYLSRRVGILESSAPLTLAECASVFGEMLVFDNLMAEEKDPAIKLSLLCGKIEDTFATVFRQIVMTDFELGMHAAARDRGELSTDHFSELWMEANQPMHGNAVSLTAEYRYWWMYIPHFIHTPFYCYAYAFAQLVVLSMYEKYKENAAAFVPGYLEMLSLGGSKRPEVLCRLVGLDIEDGTFWQRGLHLVERMVDQAGELTYAHVEKK